MDNYSVIQREGLTLNNFVKHRNKKPIRIKIDLLISSFWSRYLHALLLHSQLFQMWLISLLFPCYLRKLSARLRHIFHFISFKRFMTKILYIFILCLSFLTQSNISFMEIGGLCICYSNACAHRSVPQLAKRCKFSVNIGSGKTSTYLIIDIC